MVYIYVRKREDIYYIGCIQVASEDEKVEDNNISDPRFAGPAWPS